MTMLPLPRVVLLGTGGTIAATAGSATTLNDYTVTQSIDTLLTAIPELNAVARLRCSQVFNVESHAITNKMLLKLAGRINKELSDPAVDGVVITHGTDTLEETAYFLNLTIKSHKPVVMVGAMRPSSALSADGPLNLFNAVLLAASKKAHGHGVLVLMNDQISAARYTSKTHSTQPDSFRSHDQGYLGQIHNGKIHIFQTPTTRHTTQSEFDVTGVKSLPSVDIIYDHQNAGLHLYEASIKAGVQGIVIAATGNGSISTSVKKGAHLALKGNVVCVRSTRVGSGVVSESKTDNKLRLVSGNSLNPQKARILLMLALHNTRDPQSIQSYFDRY
ncbi:L-asparaginase [Pollutimonas nitritireducens]|uniref:L-asparaginase n=1 Tax=Pollutimonas nitritireducens TaxID=2045209 RepID=A0A2N4UHP8_9BURK|nr:type II asparaginase [Pollutimonas nitritireducens]PLC54557.1 L-asparaginase [Pollutimonas nitritireducens]